MIHPRASWLVSGRRMGTEIQHVKIIRLCGRSPSETSSYVLNKAARRCVTWCGIKDSRGAYGTAAVCVHGPFVRRFAFYAIQATTATDATIQKPAWSRPASAFWTDPLCCNWTDADRNLFSSIFFFFFYNWRENDLYLDECGRDSF